MITNLLAQMHPHCNQLSVTSVSWNLYCLYFVESIIVLIFLCTEKNGFVSATKLGTTNKFFVAATKNFAAATKRFVDKTKTRHIVVVKKYFCYPYFNK